MAWYVFALLDALPSRRAGKGLSGPMTVRDMGACYIAVERRADVPPIQLGALKTHHLVVVRLWKNAPAVLPVRFGTLLESAEIADALEGKDEELTEAFDRVRKRAQFTWRAPRASGAKPLTGAQAAASVSGTEYLRRAARASTPPARFSAIRRQLAPLVAAERYEGSRQALPETLYHLVDRTDIDAYRAAAARISSSSSVAATLSGPFPPYAFVPELLP
jgi:hypothetical protein